MTAMTAVAPASFSAPMNACAALILLLLAGCTVESKSVLGGQCDLNSECNAPLVCRLERCRVQCASLRDCPLGSYCVLDNYRQGACLLDDELTCLVDSECPGDLVCRNERCVNECEEPRDCPAGMTCADLRCQPAESGRCSLNSDCAAPLICGFDGRCYPECAEDRDCARGEVCRDAAEAGERYCELPPADTGVPPVDATMLDAGDAAVDAADASVDPDATSDASIDSSSVRRDGAPPLECSSDADCAAANAMVRCDPVTTRCIIEGCSTGFGDCDLDPANGCENDLTSTTHCRACGNLCAGPGVVCGASGCDDAIVQLSVGSTHQCFRREQGRVFCWGANRSGQLGTGDSVAQETPVAVPGIADAIDVSAGGDHTCVIRMGGAVECFGENGHGQIGNGTTTDQLSPIAVSGLPAGAIDVSAGHEQTCAVIEGGALYCWGSADDGRLGDGTASGDRVTPVAAMTTDSFAAVETADRVTCAIRDDGRVLCWGSTSNQHLGRSDTSMNRVPSLPVENVAAAIDLDNGSDFFADFSCAIETGGTMKCWGRGVGLGYGGTGSRNYGVRPFGLTTVRDMGIGTNASCAADARGDVFCWAFDPLYPTRAGIGGVTQLDMGGSNVCALHEDQRVYCWQANSGSPTLVPGF